MCEESTLKAAEQQKSVHSGTNEMIQPEEYDKLLMSRNQAWAPNCAFSIGLQFACHLRFGCLSDTLLLHLLEAKGGGES